MKYLHMYVFPVLVFFALPLTITACSFDSRNLPPKEPYFKEINGKTILCQYVFQAEENGGGDDWWELVCEEVQ